MTTYYVASAGNNANNGTSVGTAFATVDYAVNTKAVGGDTVVISGTLNQRVQLTKIFSAGARVNVIPHPTNGGLVSGNNFTLPVGAVQITNPSDGKTAHFIPLVTIDGQYITWEVDVEESLGRGIGGTGSHIIVQNCTVDYCRNACINFQDCSDITIENVQWYHGASVVESSPGIVNWPVCCHILRVATATVRNSTGGLNWGEGLAVGRGCSNILIEGNTLYDNFSTQCYADRANSTKFLRNFVFCTGTVPGVGRTEGISMRNETYGGPATPSTNGLDIAHNLVVGCTKGIVLGRSELAGELASNIRVLFNTVVNATVQGIFANATYHQAVQVKKNVFHQVTGVGVFASVSGIQPGAYTWTANAWVGRASAPPAAVASGGDINTVVLFAPEAVYTSSTIDANNYRTDASYPLAPESGIGSTDLVGATRSFWTIGALEFADVDPPDPPPAGGSAPGTVVYTTAATTSNSDQTITVTGLTGAANAVLIFASRAVTDNTAANEAIMSAGVAAGGFQGAILGIDQNGVTPSNDLRYAIGDRVVYLRGPTGTFEADAELTAFADGQITLHWHTAPATAYKLVIIPFKATLAYAGETAISVSNNGTATITTGLTAHLGFALFNSRAIPNTSGNSDNVFSLGVFSYIGSTIVQKCFSYFADDNVAATTDGARLVSNRIAHQTDGTGGTVYGVEVTSVTSSTVVVTTRGTPGVAADLMLLAMQFDDSAVYVGTDTSPTSTGVKSYSGLGFQPGVMGLITSLLTAVDTGASDGTAGAWGVSAFTESLAASMAWANEDASNPTDTQSIADDVALLVPQHDGSAGLTAAFSAFGVGNGDLNYSAVLGSARQQIVWAIEGLPATIVYLAAIEIGEELTTATVVYGVGLSAREFGEELTTANLIISVTPELFALELSEGMDVAELTLVAAETPAKRLFLSAPTGSNRISLAVHEPLISGARRIGELSSQIDSYEHSIERVGGYWAASIKINERQSVLEEWYETGLGRRIVTYSPYGRVIWEGFVNRIELNLGGLSVSIGPLLDVVNRSKLVYSFIDTSGAQALAGLRLQTDWLADLRSQARYGIFTKVLSSGGTTEDLANALVTEYLREFADPQTTQDDGASNATYMNLECLGYVHLTKTYLYNNLNTGAQNLSTKLALVLDTEPNGFITHGSGRIELNELQEPAFANNDDVAWSVISELIAKGGSDDRNRLFGIYEGRRPVYEATPNEIGYYQSLTDRARRILLPGGQVVEPWDVQPGKWLFVPDLLVGRVPSSTELPQDPRARYIESVTFRAPYEVIVNGGKVRRLDQRLARLGLAGIGG